METKTQDFIIGLLLQKKYKLDCDITLGFSGNYKFSDEEIKLFESEREKTTAAYKELLDSPQLNKQKFIDWLIKDFRDEIYEKENQKSKEHKEKCKDANYTITKQDEEQRHDEFMKFIGKVEVLNELIDKIIKMYI